MSTIAQGHAAEAAVLHAVAVVPDGSMLRLQVKSGRVRKGCVEFNSSSTDHGRGQRHYRGRADVIAVYVPALERVFMVPVDDCPTFRGYLRLDPPRNNQQRRVRLAEHYSFESWAESLVVPVEP